MNKRHIEILMFGYESWDRPYNAIARRDFILWMKDQQRVDESTLRKLWNIFLTEFDAVHSKEEQ